MCVHSVLGAKRIARQYWRAWIETRIRAEQNSLLEASPASIGGRGLKLLATELAAKVESHRPPVLAGVD